MVEEFARPVGGVACFGEASLKGFDFGVIHEVVGALVASGGACELAGKDGSPTGSTKNTGGVSIGKVNSAFCKLVDIRGNGPGSLAKTTDSIVHVIYGKEENIGLIFCLQRYVEKQKTESQ